MGYNTEFAIRVLGLPKQRPVGDMTGTRPPDLETIRNALEQVQEEAHGWSYSIYVHEKPAVGTSLVPTPFLYCNDAKWCEHVEDLDALSRRFTDLTFHVLGVGEDALFGDVWTQIFTAGKHTEKRHFLNEVLIKVQDLNVVGGTPPIRVRAEIEFTTDAVPDNTLDRIYTALGHVHGVNPGSQRIKRI